MTYQCVSIKEHTDIKEDSRSPMRDNRITFLGPRGGDRSGIVSTEVRRLLVNCREEISRSLGPLVAKFFERLDDTLFKYSEKEASGTINSTYFNALRELRVHRGEIENGIRSRVLFAFDQTWRRGGDGPIPWQPAEELKLVSDDELEESIAVTAMVTRAEARHAERLDALCLGFSRLMNGVKCDRQSNPVGPASICTAFREAIRETETDLRLRIVVYKIFERTVIDKLDNLYSGLYDLLFDIAIAPELGKSEAARADTGSRRAPREQGGHSRSKADGAELSGRPRAAPGVDDLFARLRAIARERRRLAPDEKKASIDVPMSFGMQVELVDTRELLTALGELQRLQIGLSMHNGEAVAQAGRHLDKELTRMLRLEQLGRVKRRLDDDDVDVLNVVEDLFECILDDRRIPDAMRALFARLQIPVIKAALVDPSFFRDQEHPARNVLNKLAQLAITWTDDGDRSEESLYGRIEFFVSRILMELGDDPDLFREVDQELSLFLERETAGARATEERTRQVSRGREQLRVARRRVALEIESRCGGRRWLPEVAHTLCQEAWRDVLLLTYLRQGSDSAEWKKGLSTLDRVLWSVEPKRTSAEKERLLMLIPELLSEVREGLEGISYDANKLAKLLGDLQLRHIVCLRGEPAPSYDERGAAAKDPMSRDRDWETGLTLEEPPTSGSERSVSARGRLSDEDLDVAAVRALGIDEGTWVEVVDDLDVRTRAKLAWRSEEGDMFVFVNRKGVKVAELGARELGALLRTGRAEILAEAEVPVIERALAMMMKSLRDSEEFLELPAI